MVDIANKGFFLVPESAIACFEQCSGLDVSLHQIEDLWREFLPAKRFGHGNHLCECVKDRGFERDCLRFEIDNLRPYLRGHADGCVKLCHAGLLELAVPIMHGGRVAAVIFAGPIGRSQRISVDYVDDHQTDALKRLPKELQEPKALTQQEADLYLEGLRQLAARLQLWMEERLKMVDDDFENVERPKGPRREAIERFVAQNYRDPVKLEDLAKELHLSRSRTAHAVKEVCGLNFGDILKAYRLRRAAGMIWLTECSIAEAAEASGFGDLSNFHKSFRKHYGMTPLEYRKQQKAMNVAVHHVA